MRLETEVKKWNEYIDIKKSVNVPVFSNIFRSACSIKQVLRRLMKQIFMLVYPCVVCGSV